MNLISSFNKKALYTLLIVFTFLFTNGFSQEVPNLSFIQTLDVSYKESDMQFVDSVKMVRMQSAITIANSGSVKKIHLKMINPVNSNVVYQVSYELASQIIKSNDGIILFKKEGSVCNINSSIEIPHTIYEFQLTTEDAQGTLSEIYSESK